MAKLNKVLVAYDGSPHSKEALHWAVYFSRHSGSSVTAVKVFEPFLSESKWREVGVLPDNFAKFQQLQKNDLDLMAGVKEFGRNHGVTITTEVLREKLQKRFFLMPNNMISI